MPHAVAFLLGLGVNGFVDPNSPGELLSPGGWEINGLGVTFQDGILTFDSSADGSGLSQDLSADIQNTNGPYFISITVQSITQGTVSLAAFSLNITSPGTYSIPVSDLGLFISITSSLSDAVVTNISLKRLEDSRLGTELISNGNFSSGAGWTLTTPPWRISGGVLESYDDQVASAYAVAIGATVISGQIYRMIFTVTGVDTGPLIYVKTGPATYEEFDGNDHSVNGTVTKTIYVVAEDSGDIAFYNQAYLFTVDNASLKKYTLPS